MTTNMTETIKLCKFGNASWGMRISGGIDFGTAPTVLKVVKGSVAENGGIKVGDMFVSINCQCVTDMTHKQIHEFLLNAGDELTLEIERYVPRNTVPDIHGISNAEDQGTTTVHEETEENCAHKVQVPEITSTDTSIDDITKTKTEPTIAAPEVEEVPYVPLTEEELIELMRPVPLELPIEELSLPPLPESRQSPLKPHIIEVKQEQTLFQEEFHVNTEDVIEDIHVEPVKSEIKPEHEPVKSEIKPEHEPVKSEIKPEHEPVKSEIIPEHEPVKTEIKPEDSLQLENKDEKNSIEKEESAIEENETPIVAEEENTQPRIEKAIEKISENIVGKEVQEDVTNKEIDPQDSENTDRFETENLAEQEEKSDGQEEVKKELSEDEIAEILSGTAEVVTGTTIGVNFLKVGEEFTKLVEESKVMAVLKEEESGQDKKISTFLQTPKRPKIKPKEKPKPVPPKAQETIIEPPPEIQNEIEDVSSKNLENTETNDDHKEVADTTQESAEPSQEEQSEIEVTTKVMDEITEEERCERLKDEQMKSELLEIRNQLISIIQLPSKLQKQLDSIQHQLASLLHIPVLDDDQHSVEFEEKGNPEKENEEITTDENVIPDFGVKSEGIETEEPNERIEEETENNVECDDVQAESCFNKENDNNESRNDEDYNADDRETMEQGEADVENAEDEVMENVSGRKKDIKWQRDPPKKNRPFFPLTPKPRPIILPGRNLAAEIAKKYDDDFIAETLSGNAEVILGTTLGVNFRKFQKNYDHLQNSKVYRAVHEMDKSRENFPLRSGKIAATEDYIIAAQT